MADQTKDPKKEKKTAGKKPVKKEKAPAPPPVKTVSRRRVTGPVSTDAGTLPAADTTPSQTAPEAAASAAKAEQAPAPAAAQKQERRKPKADSEQVRLKKEEQARRSRRRNRQLIGLAVAILVVVGAVSIVMNGIQMAQNLFDDSGQIEEYENRFKAFVWFDMLPFDSVSLVDENSIKQVIIWSIFDDQSETLARNENGEALVPASEVDRYGTEIFGPDFRFSGHGDFRDQVFDLTYNYDPDTMMYAVPATSLNNNYLPRVMEVVREPGGIRRVVMGYVSAINSDNQVVASPDYEHPVRYMDYMLRRDGNGYYLYAIQNNTTYAASLPASSGSGAASAVPEESQPALEREDPLLSVDSSAAASSPAESESQPPEEDSSTGEGDDSETRDDSAA